jgi:hypothetical protein
MIEQSAIDLANNYLDAASGDLDTALVMLAATHIQATRHISGGFVRCRPTSLLPPPEPKAITDDWIDTGKAQRPD